ncbi:MAG: hypothetical protein ACTSXQ_01205 [Alphaproteobacteria bacterium]
MTTQTPKTEDKKIKVLTDEIAVLARAVETLESRLEDLENKPQARVDVGAVASRLSLNEKVVKFAAWIKMNPILGACVIGAAGIFLGLLLD